MLYQKKYEGFNIIHFTEYLVEREGIAINRESVRKILRGSDIYAKKKRRYPKHRTHREPMPCEGLLSQMDTSDHLWLPSLGRRVNLIAIINDATGKFQNAKLVLSDSTVENLLVMKEMFERYGLPSAIYVDRASKFTTTRYGSTEYNIVGSDYRETQIARAMSELGSS